MASVLSVQVWRGIYSRTLAGADPYTAMIRHPLLRCALFVVTYFLAVFLLDSFRGSFYWNVALNQLAVFIATGVMLALDRRGLRFIGLSFNSAWWRQILAGFALGVGMIAIIAIMLRAAGAVQWHAQPVRVASWINLAALFLLAAIGEELLFRGYAFQRLIESVGRPITLIVLSLFFAAGHYRNPNASWPGLANTVLVGLLFGFAYLRTGRLWLPIACHWGWNLAEASFGFPVSGIKLSDVPCSVTISGSPLLTGGAYGPEASILATIVLFAGLFLVLRLGHEPKAAS